jgi:hypothetical protein
MADSSFTPAFVTVAFVLLHITETSWVQLSCPTPSYNPTIAIIMSKLSDYSKFDHLDDSSEEENEGAPATLDESEAISPAIHEQQQQQQQQQQEEEPIATTRKDPKTGRYVFEYGGTTIYEWEQSLEGVFLVCLFQQNFSLPYSLF